MTSEPTVIILAGGRGSRLGFPKDRLAVAGKPILVHLLDQLRHAGPTILVASPARPEPTGFERFDRVLLDASEYEGPLHGLGVALPAVETPRLALLSVDMPNVGREQIDWLSAMLDEPDVAGVLPTRIADGRTLVEPFPSILLASTRDAILSHYAGGARSIRSLLDLPGIVARRSPRDWSADVWRNLNRPEDVESLDPQG